jgi:hypothetical protein
MMMSDFATTHAARRSAQSTVALAVIVVLLVAACATTAPISGERPGVTVPPAETAPIAPSPPVPQAPPLPRNVEPPPPKLNLSGFPLPYRQGYADGCSSAGDTERKDAARYSSDMNYRTGWADGRALCTKK